MIDDRFSAEAFEALGSRDEQIALESALQAEIAAEITPALSDALAAVVVRLNALGHDLRETSDPECYDDGDSARGTLRLRVCLDATITVMWRGGAF
jgi:hypothetical protein